MMNVSFQGLKGLSVPDNSKILRKMGQKMQKSFTDPAMDAFGRIHAASGSKDVFIKIEEQQPIVSTGKYTTYKISINDRPEKGKTITRASILYSPTFTEDTIYEECSRALSSLATSFEFDKASNTAGDSVDKMIDTYA